MEEFKNGTVVLYPGDCMEVIKGLPNNSIDSVCSDPPYALVSIVKRFGKTSVDDKNQTCERCNGRLDPYARAARGFMGKEWDNGETAFNEMFWSEVMRVLKPGGHMAVFGGTRTAHRMVCAIEDAGFEIRDTLAWVYGSGFPKSHDVSKGIDKAAGAKQWDGWGTALKPAWENITLARKPLSEPTVAANVLKWGTGAINVDGCRVAHSEECKVMAPSQANILNPSEKCKQAGRRTETLELKPSGRWPANLCHDGSEEVLDLFPETAPSKAGMRGAQHSGRHGGLADLGGNIKEGTNTLRGIDDNGGSAARFFYCAKASKADRANSKHPTVKPIKLMRWLVRLITPLGGTVLDPFSGTGTTGQAAFEEGFKAVLIEREAEYQDDIRNRMNGKHTQAQW